MNWPEGGRGANDDDDDEDAAELLLDAADEEEIAEDERAEDAAPLEDDGAAPTEVTLLDGAIVEAVDERCAVTLADDARSDGRGAPLLVSDGNIERELDDGSMGSGVATMSGGGSAASGAGSPLDS